MADKKKILIADDFQLLREDLTELINNQRDMDCFFRKRDCKSCQKHRV